MPILGGPSHGTGSFASAMESVNPVQFVSRFPSVSVKGFFQTLGAKLETESALIRIQFKNGMKVSWR
jgi:hypothetical protein